MFSNISHNYKGIIFALIGFSAFTFSDAAVKWLLQSYSTSQIIATNAILMLLILSIISPKLGGFRKTFQTKKLKVHFFRSLTHTAISVIAVLSLTKLPIAQIYTLFFVAPFIATVVSIPLFKERVDSHGWIAILLGFTGVLAVFRPGFTDADPWLLLPLLGAIVIAAGFILARMLPKGETLLSLGIFPCLSNFIILVPLALPSMIMPALGDMPLFFLSSCSLIIGTTFLALAFRSAKASIIGPFHYVQIIWALLFGYFIFGDVPTLWSLLGATLIIGSGIYLIEREYRKT